MQERLQKIIAATGMASRRGAEEMILHGEVMVNGKLITELGSKADPEKDHIKVRGKLINPKREEQENVKEKKYYLLNKPKGYVSTVKDPKGRQIVAHLLPPSSRRGLHPVGRLDFNTEGLLILTNDGELTQLLTKAGKVKKVYQVKVKGEPNPEQLQRLRLGISLEGKRTAPAEIKLLERTVKGGNCWYEVTLIQGKNQQIRKMFDLIGHSVTKLKRIRIGHLTDDKLPVGQYRELKRSEVQKFLQSDAPAFTNRPKKIRHKNPKKSK
jgi:23S rRNA pseudouridine2605 synthase